MIGKGRASGYACLAPSLSGINPLVDGHFILSHSFGNGEALFRGSRRRLLREVNLLGEEGGYGRENGGVLTSGEEEVVAGKRLKVGERTGRA